jgi:hypothetical protein
VDDLLTYLRGENEAGTEKVIMVVSVIGLVLFWLLMVVGGVVVVVHGRCVGMIVSGCVGYVGDGGVGGMCQGIWYGGLWVLVRCLCRVTRVRCPEW